MAGWDLNRQWRHPEEQSSPTIYWSKALLKWMCGDIDKKPLVITRWLLKGVFNLTNLFYSPQLCCDFHGHSRKKNIFMFGNGKDSIDHVRDGDLIIHI